ncbi:MAG TPA: DUF255 domain-containing protein [Candidatus Binataceae bacterium]
MADSADALPPNALADAPSLYLRKASAGPVRWQPWGAPAFSLARKLHRPVLLDIGAMWCHWCHVMDETTYSDAKVADLINRNFVPIKVDTDERPDIDAYYQDAAGAFGAGGWPLTCFTADDAAPVFIAGYMPPDAAERTPRGFGMLWVLDRVQGAYANDPNFAKVAHDLAAKIAEHGSTLAADHTTADGLRARILIELKASYDRDTGGFGAGKGPRFYDFPAIQLALAHGFFGHPEYTAMALDTLRKIAAGGVYDQLGGGFHRYSTDPNWRVPHFEKMGYDQAMGLRAYAEAYQASGDRALAEVARSIVGYVNGSLLDPKTHTFYSHQDADSFAGDNGGYYTWTADEVKRAMAPAQARAALLYFGFSDLPARAPNGRIVLRVAMDSAQLAERMQVPEPRAKQLIAQARAAMLAARQRRKTPQVDHAVMTDRNALMASAYLSASQALGDPQLARIALDDLDFILAHLRAPDGGYYHEWSNSRASVPGLAADQVYLLAALVDAYQMSGETKYLAQARVIATWVMKSRHNGLLANRTTIEFVNLVALQPATPQVMFDQPMPSVEATAAIAMATLAALISDPSYAQTSSDLLKTAPAITGAMPPSTLGTLGLALERSADGEAVVAIVAASGVGARASASAAAASLTDAALRTYRPFKVVMRIDSANGAQSPPAMRAMLAASAGRNVPLAFVCAGTACANPVEQPARLADLIRKFGVATESKGGLAQR